MHKDPATGDPLSHGEYISWRIQGLIRNWTFLALITVATIIIWATDNSAALTWWNLCASYLALVIESIVGIAMFSQTRRDAVCLREVRAIDRHIEEQDTAMLGILTKLNSQEDLILRFLEQHEVSIDGPDEDAFYDLTENILNEIYAAPKTKTP